MVVFVIALGVVILLLLTCAGALVGLYFFRASASFSEQQATTQVPTQVAPIPANIPPPAAAFVPSDPARVQWSYLTSPEGASGSLRQVDAQNWVETRTDNVVYQFSEVNRTGDFVELFDVSRMLHVRLYADHMEWGRGDSWASGQAGAWQQAAAESPVPLPF